MNQASMFFTAVVMLALPVFAAPPCVTATPLPRYRPTRLCQARPTIVRFVAPMLVMPRGLREKLARRVRAEKNGSDGDIDPNRTFTRMYHEAISYALAAADPHTDPDGAVANSNQMMAAKVLRDTDRKVRAMGFVHQDLVNGFPNDAKPKRAPAAAA